MRFPLYISLFVACCLTLSTVSQAQTPQLTDPQKPDQSQAPTPPEQWTQIAPGLDMQIIKPGQGDRQVVEDDIVVIAYNAKVKDAKTYFAATQPNKGFKFQINQSKVLPGIKKGIIGMRVGEHRKLMLAPAYGFGNKANKHVPAGSILIVNVIMDRIQTPVRWETLAAGHGEREAQKGDVLKVQYVGKLEDGTVFDANQSFAMPFVFGLGSSHVIAGMNIGSIGIKVGETRRIVIPASFGYGSKARRNIPANSTLTFDLTCLSIEDGVVFKTTKTSDGPAIQDGQTGIFAIRIEAITGKILLNTQFGKGLKISLNETLDPYGLYIMAKGMRVGEVREGSIKPQLGFQPGKNGAGKALNVTLDLIEIVKPEPEKKAKDDKSEDADKSDKTDVDAN